MNEVDLWLNVVIGATAAASLGMAFFAYQRHYQGTAVTHEWESTRYRGEDSRVPALRYVAEKVDSGRKTRPWIIAAGIVSAFTVVGLILATMNVEPHSEDASLNINPDYLTSSFVLESGDDAIVSFDEGAFEEARSAISSDLTEWISSDRKAAFILVQGESTDEVNSPAAMLAIAALNEIAPELSTGAVVRLLPTPDDGEAGRSVQIDVYPNSEGGGY